MPVASITLPRSGGRHTGRRGGLRRALPGLLLGGLLGLAPLSALPARAATTTYHVDCAAGNDAASGISASAAWRTIGRANGAKLRPGDHLLLKRGCSWRSTLYAKWNGTAESPITIGAYGVGERPVLQDSQDQVYVTGSHLVIESIKARADAVTHDPQCQNARAGRRSGFRLAAGASYDTLRDLVATDLTFGIKLEAGSHHNRVLRNVLSDNDMKSDIWTSDAGAVGIVLFGDDNEVAYNTVSGSDVCSRFYGRDGSAIEVFGGQRNRIHHNRAIDNNQFAELGNARSADNVYAYNVVTSTLRDGHFLTTRGPKDTAWGPVMRTKALNNTVYLTGAASFAIQCAGGCAPSILTLRNNVVWAADRVGYADAGFDEGNNVYWSPGGPRVWFPMTASSRKADPAFVAPSAGDLHIRSTSPAVDAGWSGVLGLGYTSDFDGASLPRGPAVDIGAYEYGAAGAQAAYASDAFSRTVSDSWGSVDTGGRYQTQGPAADYDVAGGRGVMRMPARGVLRKASLTQVGARDVDSTVNLSLDAMPSRSGVFVYILTRESVDGTGYRSKVRLAGDGHIQLRISRANGGAETPLAAEKDVGTFSPGTGLWLRTQVSGSSPTTIRAKGWRVGTPEPSAWQLVVTDATAALQDAGHVALQAYTSSDAGGAVVRFDEWTTVRP